MKRNLNLKLQSICNSYDISLALVNDTIIASHSTGTIYYPFVQLSYDKEEAAEVIILGFDTLRQAYYYDKTNNTIHNLLMHTDREIEAINELNLTYVIFRIDNTEYQILKSDFSGEAVKKIIEDLDDIDRKENDLKLAAKEMDRKKRRK